MSHDHTILYSSWGYLKDLPVRQRLVEVAEVSWLLFQEVELTPFRSDNAAYNGRSVAEFLGMYDDFDGLFFQARAMDGVLSKEEWVVGALDYSFDVTPLCLRPYSKLNQNRNERRRYNDRLFEVLRTFGSMPHCRELWCRHTAFVGDPYFLYRPPFMRMLDDFTVFKQAIQPVNAMLDVLAAHIDRDEILEVVKNHGIKIESMPDNKVFFKFCDMFEDWVKNPLIKNPKDILKEVRTKVESRLRQQGVSVDWLAVKVPTLPKFE